MAIENIAYPFAGQSNSRFRRQYRLSSYSQSRGCLVLFGSI